MTHEFKSGDKVRLKTETTWTVRMAENKGVWQLLHLDGGDTAYSLAFELVEPTITHRELREACKEMGDCQLLRELLEKLTGEQP